jgi:hypothetical protein
MTNDVESPPPLILIPDNGRAANIPITLSREGVQDSTVRIYPHKQRGGRSLPDYTYVMSEVEHRLMLEKGSRVPTHIYRGTVYGD